MSATTTAPAWKRPGATSSPTLRPCIVTVTVASTHAPATSPVEASTPEGRSTETTGTPAPLIASTLCAASSRGSPWKPVPKSASRITSAPSTPSLTTASRPAAAITSTAIRPSPPFAPLPQTATNRRASGNRRIASSATTRPARAISSSTSWPASARFISSAVYRGSSIGDEGHRLGELARVGHRELDLPGAHALGPRLRLPAQRHARLRPARDLDLAPREPDARAERLADRLLAGEARGVVLRRVRLRVAVGALGVGEAALAGARVALQRPRDPRDLDQVDAHTHGRNSKPRSRSSRAAPRSR